MSQLVIARWSVQPDFSFNGTSAPCRSEFVANVFEAMSWFYDD